MVRSVALLLLVIPLSTAWSSAPAAAQEETERAEAAALDERAPASHGKRELSSGRKRGTVAPKSPSDTIQRLTAKVEQVKAGAQQWAASGKDPAELSKIMQEEFQPRMQAGKIAEAEAVVDRVLERLGAAAATPSANPAKDLSAEERVLAKVHSIQKIRSDWVEGTDRKAAFDALLEKLRKQLAELDFAEAEGTADQILEMMGGHVAPADPAANQAGAKDGRNAFAALLPQRLVYLAADRIALTPEQRDQLSARVTETQPRLEELKVALEHESAHFLELTQQERVEETAVLEQLDRILDLEREAKQLQARQGVAIQNLLTAEQKATLRQLGSHPEAVAKLEEELKSRIEGKVERLTAAAQAWVQSGRDPAFVTQAMEQKVRPLMESGRILEGEADVDRLLEQLNQDAK